MSAAVNSSNVTPLHSSTTQSQTTQATGEQQSTQQTSAVAKTTDANGSTAPQ